MNGKKIIMLPLLLAAAAARATPSLPPGMPNGGCWANPMNQLQVKVSRATFSANTEGSTGKVSFKTTPDVYPEWCYSQSGPASASYFTSTIKKPQSEKQSGYFKLTDDIDYRLTFDDLTTAPFKNFYNQDASSGPGGYNAISPLNGARIGNAGTITFRLRRTIIGGAFSYPGEIELANLYRYVYSSMPSTVPMIELITEQTVVPIPVECRINNGQTISVAFGNVDSTLVTASPASSPYRADRALTYKCNTALTQDINVSLDADPAGFGDAIKTSNPDLGVVMQYHSQTVRPNGAFKTRLIDGQGSDSVSFALVGSGAKKPVTGPFSGSATLIITNL
ncbi:putative fimbrial protein StiH [Klebsiella pneumoniae]|nr:putative fimbrial protein StiH [Klebsiella pneumoniae]